MVQNEDSFRFLQMCITYWKYTIWIELNVGIKYVEPIIEIHYLKNWLGRVYRNLKYRPIWKLLLTHFYGLNQADFFIIITLL